MFGFVVGTACLIGLIAMIRRGRYGRWGGGFGPRRFLNRIFERLDTSPSQEKAVVAAVEEVAAAGRSMRPELDLTRQEIAALLREETFDAERLGNLYARHDEQLRRMRETFAASLAKVHATLDPAQRVKLAQMVEERGLHMRRHHRHGPYREAVHV